MPTDDADKPPDPAARPSAGPSLDIEAQPPLAELPGSAIAFDPIPQADSQAVYHGEATPKDNGVQDPMNALWDFEGHRLRELRPASMNPFSVAQQSLRGGDAGGGATPGTAVPDVDDDGHAVLYGSCGRDKRYARCAVCYFRGLRCNTDHYCACCQRPVCIRPRKYPGEEHPKICWNVLHMDKDMMQRVEKKKKRKLQVMSAVSIGSSGSLSAVSSAAATSLQDDQREQQADIPTLTSETHDHGDAVALDPDPQRQLSDTLSSTSVVL
jgi:hypothetical protein